MLKRIRQLTLVLFSLILVITPLAIKESVGAAPTISEFPIPTSNANLWDTTLGPDGAIWFTEQNADKIGRISAAGSVTEYSIPKCTFGWGSNGACEPEHITTGPDGALWFTEESGYIGRITTAGVITQFHIFASGDSITTGPDGALWFALGNKIGRITTSGEFTTYTVSASTGLNMQDIIVGPDGAIWYSVYSNGPANGFIGRITTGGIVSTYTLPGFQAEPGAIASGPDGAIWFTESHYGSNNIDRMTVSGVITNSYPVPHIYPSYSLVAGPDNTIWFIDGDGAQYPSQYINNMTLSGQITSSYQVATTNVLAQNLVFGSDNNLWFIEFFNNSINRLNLNPAPSAPQNLTAPTPTQQPTLSWPSISSATSYTVYRGGTNIASVPAPTGSTVTYTDSTAPEGNNTYYVTASNSSGESPPSNSVSVLVDRTGPNVTGTPDSSLNGNGWYNHDVTINWISTDPSPSSGAPTQPAPTVASLEGTNTYTSTPSCDPVVNCNTGSLSLKIDKTAPTISYTVTPTPNFSNWLNSNATVTFTCDDAISGIDSCTAPVILSSDGGNQTVTGTAVDKAANTATITATINLDKTAPLITSTLSQAPNAYGWHNTPVTVSYTCTDATSGVATCSDQQTVSTDGTTTLTGTATDNAGNTSTTATQVNLDKTAPDITYTVSPTLNSNGWTTSNTLTVTFSCTDATSGVDTCTDPVTLTGDGAYVVTGTATDKAGNTTSINALVGIDTTQPTITASVSPTPNVNGWNNTSPVTVSFTCTDNTSGSGIASCPTSQTITTEGSYTLSGTAVDVAGNTQTILVPVNLDATAPIVSNLAWSANPLTAGQNTTLSATVTDNLSGPATVYYTIDGGAPQPMTYDSASATWKATFGSTLGINTYAIAVFAVDNAGNTSIGTMDVLSVASSGSVSGHAKLIPTSSDTLPIALDTATHNPTQLVIGFSGPNGSTNSVEAHYVVRNNQNEFSIASTTVDWVGVADATHASVMAHGNLTTYVNGVQTITQNVAMRIDIVLGTNGPADHITLRVWNPGEDTNTTTPSYVVSEDDLTQSNISLQ